MRLGKYELLSGSAMSAVPRAQRARFETSGGGTALAGIQTLGQAAGDDFLTLLFSESKLVERLIHPNVLQVYELGQSEGVYFAAMEWVDGRSLAQILARAAELRLAFLPPSAACFLAIDALEGLQCAHTLAAGGQPLAIVHGRLSAENLLVTFAGRTKVAGFCSVMALGPQKLSGCLSPEQARGDRLDPRSDVFVMGVLLYRMLCGVMPFAGTDLEMIKAILECRFKPVEQANPLVPAPLAQVVGRAMAKDREQRYGSALELKEALAAVLRAQDPTFSSETIKDWMSSLFPGEAPAKVEPALEPVAPPAPKPPPKPAAPEVPRSMVWPVIASIVGFVALSGLAALALRTEPEQGPPRADAPVVPQPSRPLKGPPVLPRPAAPAQLDVAPFPRSVTVRGERHRIRFEGLALPGAAFTTAPTLVERGATDTDSPFFARTRSADAAHDGEVTLVLQRPVTLGGAASFQLFDFHPFEAPARGATRTLEVGTPPVPLAFADTAAQIDARAATWFTVENVPPDEKVRLTLKALSPEVWAKRPRPASVVVVWKRAFGRLLPPPGGDWPDEVDRAVLVEGTPLIIEHATALAIAFADSLATSESDSVLVEVFGTGEPASKPDPAAVARAAAAHLKKPVTALFDEALTLYRAQKYAQARSKLERCVDVQARDFDCHRLLGAVLEKLGEPKRAVAAYREFVRLAPEGDPDVAKVSALIRQHEAQP